MLVRLSTAESETTSPAIGSDSESTVGSDSEWFFEASQQLLGKDAGYALSLLTGLPEGSCYKYVKRKPTDRRKPPGYLIRQLLRSPQGKSWLNAIMDGSDAEWFTRLQRAERIADAIKDI